MDVDGEGPGWVKKKSLLKLGGGGGGWEREGEWVKTKEFGGAVFTEKCQRCERKFH